MLEPLFSPRSIAVIGASREPGKVGHAVLNNIIQYGYTGKIYPINPSAQEVLGLPCMAKVGNIQDAVDLAVIIERIKKAMDAEFDIKRFLKRLGNKAK